MQQPFPLARHLQSLYAGRPACRKSEAKFDGLSISCVRRMGDRVKVFICKQMERATAISGLTRTLARFPRAHLSIRADVFRVEIIELSALVVQHAAAVVLHVFAPHLNQLSGGEDPGIFFAVGASFCFVLIYVYMWMHA